MKTSFSFNKQIIISNGIISEASPVFVIAEAGVNHNGDIKIAKKLIEIAAESGADAVKFQAFRTDNLILRDVQKAFYQKQTTNSNETQYNMLKRLEVTKEQNLELKRHCEEKGIIFLTTPFDEKSLDEIDELDLPAYKIASSDTTNLPFLKKVAKKGKPIFLSSGMSYLSEVKMALETIYEYNRDVVLLQCTANYPIDDEEANLLVLNTYKDNFDILLGYSDHSVGIGAAPFAVPMGTKVVEKHFTFDKKIAGPDQRASLSPSQLKEFVKTIRKVEKYLGTTIKFPSFSEAKNRVSLQKNLVARKKISCGDVLGEESIVAKRTGGQGISPIYFKNLVGRKASKEYNIDDIIDE